MGNRHAAMEPSVSDQCSIKSILDFSSDNFIVEDNENGLCLFHRYLPEEIIINILSFVDPKEILTVSLVCKRWRQIVRSSALWKTVYERIYRKKAKKLPWFVYYCLFSTNLFDKNLLENGNGQDKYKHWLIAKNFGDGFQIEHEPHGSDPLPEMVPEFNNHKSCFATSFGECVKFQRIPLNKSNLFPIIFDYYKPLIYTSEWWTGRFDCGCVYTLRILLRKEGDPGYRGDEPTILKEFVTTKKVEQWAGKEWDKVEMTISEYPEGVQELLFLHEGKDTQFWKGHYGSKMAGGVVKVIFDSIAPKENDIYLDTS